MNDKIKDIKTTLDLEKMMTGLMYGIDINDEINIDHFSVEDLIILAKESIIEILNILAEKTNDPYHGPRMAITFIVNSPKLLALTSPEKLREFLKNFDELQDEIKKITAASLNKIK